MSTHRLVTAMLVLVEYGEKNGCSVWLERTVSGHWHARISHYGVYDGGSSDKDPLVASQKALACATIAKHEKSRHKGRKATR